MNRKKTTNANDQDQVDQHEKSLAFTENFSEGKEDEVDTSDIGVSNLMLVRNRSLYNYLVDVVNYNNYSKATEILKVLRNDGINISIYKLRRFLAAANITKVTNYKGEKFYKLNYSQNRLTLESKVEALVISVLSNNVCVIIKTVPAGAQIVAKICDSSAKELDILGTIAGDDTVMLIPRDTEEISKVKRLVKRLFKI
ncbi:hypothetical protein CJP74_07960 [Psittacicella melopsittaci]|uniref:Arginine repressor n=1 Tax=Psittacicella melopsittaci TaxID=2028576 RepID=A0A3A1Y559_9GAMM|nr:hypothetical protein [Psittacicella melopsittaci]RIY31164.1 hypothetical protein CJP74_07960 [Psittacicella melopsittaci]